MPSFNIYFVIDNPIVSQEATLTITETKLYVPDVTLSIQDNAKLLWQLKPGYKRTINWNRYEQTAMKKIFRFLS